jgi:hypothetical protein
LPKGEDYIEQLMNYQDKYLWSFTILSQGNEATLHLCEYDWKRIALIKPHPLVLDQGNNTQDDKGIVDLKVRTKIFQVGSLVLMWYKTKGTPNTHKEFDILWHGPYKIEKKSGIGSFYLFALEGRRFPLPINGSLIKPYHAKGT